jgi:hypothetical protein
VLGAPLEPEQGGKRSATEQQFENGRCSFPNDRPDHVLFGAGRGTFRKFEQKEMQLPTPPAPPEDCPADTGGFALV